MQHTVATGTLDLSGRTSFVEATHVTTSLIFYVGISVLAAILCLWSGATAAMRVPEHQRSHRVITSLAATLLLPVAAAAALAAPLGFPELGWVSLLLPFCVLGATWSNVMTLRDQSASLKVLHLPTFLFNCTLLGLYFVRLIQDFLGQDLATWGGALTIAHVSLQTQVGHIGAAANPVWFHLPFLLPLSLRFRWPQTTALVVSSVVSCYLLYLLVLAMPQAHTRSQSYRLATPPKIEQARQVPLGVKVPWGLDHLAASMRWDIREALLDLKPSHVTTEVAPHTFDEENLLEQLQRELSWAREQGYKVIVVCMPPVGVAVMPSGSLLELKRLMAETQWLAAERLKPDLQVLYSGPFGQLANLISKPPTIDEWMETIRTSAQEVRQANAKVEVAVSIESLAPHAAELFRHLKAPNSPVDVVGLSIFPGGRLVDDLDKDLSKLKRLVERTPGDRRVCVLETGCAPQAVGGEHGQWRFLERVLAFCANTEQVQLISIDSLQDPSSGFGLLTFTGRRRQVFEHLRTRNDASEQPGNAPGK